MNIERRKEIDKFSGIADSKVKITLHDSEFMALFEYLKTDTKYNTNFIEESSEHIEHPAWAKAMMRGMWDVYKDIHEEGQ